MAEEDRPLPLSYPKLLSVLQPGSIDDEVVLLRQEHKWNSALDFADYIDLKEGKLDRREEYSEFAPVG